MKSKEEIIKARDISWMECSLSKRTVLRWKKGHFWKSRCEPSGNHISWYQFETSKTRAKRSRNPWGFLSQRRLARQPVLHLDRKWPILRNRISSQSFRVLIWKETCNFVIGHADMHPSIIRNTRFRSIITVSGWVQSIIQVLKCDDSFFFVSYCSCCTKRFSDGRHWL